MSAPCPDFGVFAGAFCEGEGKVRVCSSARRTETIAVLGARSCQRNEFSFTRAAAGILTNSATAQGERRAESGERRAESGERRAESGERRALR